MSSAIAWFAANRSRAPSRTLAFWRPRASVAVLQPGDEQYYSATLAKAGDLLRLMISAPRTDTLQEAQLWFNTPIGWPGGRLPAGTVLRASVFNSGRIAQIVQVTAFFMCSDRRQYPCLLVPEPLEELRA
jgi:hypothetical protein